MVEHRIRNARVAGSNPAFGSTPCHAMISTTAKPRQSRTLRREALSDGIGRLIGCRTVFPTAPSAACQNRSATHPIVMLSQLRSQDGKNVPLRVGVCYLTLSPSAEADG